MAVTFLVTSQDFVLVLLVPELISSSVFFVMANHRHQNSITGQSKIGGPCPRLDELAELNANQ